MFESQDINQRQRNYALESLVAHKNEIHNHKLEQFCLELSGNLVDAYRNNKVTSEDDRNVIRQALSLISHQTDITHIRECVKREINASQLKRSKYKDHFDHITDYLDMAEIVDIADKQCDFLMETASNESIVSAVSQIKLSLEICLRVHMKLCGEFLKLPKVPM